MFMHFGICGKISSFMPIETRSNSALFRRAEQLKRWEDSETNQVTTESPVDKKSRIKFSDGCVFLAACAASDTEEVERLLEQAADINTANVDGLTALHQACIDDNLEMVQFLVEHGCDVNRGDNEGWTPLHATASCGFISIAKYLIEHGANVAAVNNDGDLPIDIAESQEMEDLLSDVLDEQGIDCDEARSEEERIMLEDAKKMLNSNKFQDKVHPRTGATALHVAAAKSYINVLKLLIQAGADLNAQDNDGWTPLHAAAHWGQKEACAILADNLANMDIQNLAGQTCFDVAEPDLVKLLEELKKKQASMQKERPEIQAILQRTSTRPPLKRRTSVTRMSGQEKSKSVIKDTKSERAQIEQLCLPEEENEEEKEKKQNETSQRLPAPKTENVEKEVKVVQKKENILGASAPKEKPPVSNEPQTERIPSWKKLIRRTSDNSIGDVKPLPIEEPVVAVKKPKKADEVEEKETSNGPVTEDGKDRPFIPPLRDDESELQRKAHARRVRETRRSTQGVLLEDLKSAEMQYLLKTQQEAVKRQEEERAKEQMEKESEKEEEEEEDNERSPSPPPSSVKNKSSTERPSLRSELQKEKETPQPPKVKSLLVSPKEDTSKEMANKSLPETPSTPDSPPSVTVSLRTKTQSNNSSIVDEQSQLDNKASLGTQAAIQRRRRPKRRSTGVVYLDSDDAQDEKTSDIKKDDSSEAPKEKKEMGMAERARLRYGSSSSIPDTSSEVSCKSEISRYSSRSSLNEDNDTDYKKLYEDLKKENERLREDLKKTEEELEKTKMQLQKSTQSNNNKNSASDIEKKERRALERKLSEMEEEIKLLDKLKAENERLRDENGALIRVISKLSK